MSRRATIVLWLAVVLVVALLFLYSQLTAWPGCACTKFGGPVPPSVTVTH
jgi:hypothetical protein